MEGYVGFYDKIGVCGRDIWGFMRKLGGVEGLFGVLLKNLGMGKENGWGLSYNRCKSRVWGLDG